MNFLTNFDFQDKVVMDMGCGHGLLGILALLLGAKLVIFQDFNSVVINNVTIPNINQNTSGGGLKEKCRFLTGDWENMEPLGKVCEEQKVDVIVGSEVIYNEGNYAKIAGLFKKWIKQDGCAVLANKQYYFGVGGNMNSFREFLEKEGFDI